MAAMVLEEFVNTALDAIGGVERVLGVRSYRAEIRREGPTGSADVVVRRAAGGRVSIEETRDRTRTVLRVEGDDGWRGEGPVGAELPMSPLAPEEVAEIRRAARLAPRNLLAHAGEYSLSLSSPTPGPDGRMALALDFPAESMRYFFDPETLLCSASVDGARGRSVFYEDYRTVAGIATPFLERERTGDGGETTSVYLSAAYNEDMSAEC